MNRQNIVRILNSSFPTVWHNATKFGVNQILMAIKLASISGILFDSLESYFWDYLVKVKLKNLEDLLKVQDWSDVEGVKDVSICEFSYRAKSWQHSRTLKAMRSVKEYVEISYLGEKKIVPVYQYVCYISSYDMNAMELHDLYKQRSTSETWIEQVRGHVMAGSTLTNDFWANDILWQLSVFAYNISVMMRQKKNRFIKQEHRSFIEWFIAVPAKITRSGHQTESKIANTIENKQLGEQLKMYEHHFYRDDWE